MRLTLPTSNPKSESISNLNLCFGQPKHKWTVRASGLALRSRQRDFEFVVWTTKTQVEGELGSGIRRVTVKSDESN